MANKFTESAKSTLGGSPVMQGRTKITTDELIKNFGSCVTITEVDMIIKADNTAYPVIAFKEAPDKYFNGGTLINRVVDDWLATCDGDIDAVNVGLKECGGVPFKVSTKKTKSGKTITAFEVIE